MIAAVYPASRNPYELKLRTARAAKSHEPTHKESTARKSTPCWESPNTRAMETSAPAIVPSIRKMPLAITSPLSGCATTYTVSSAHLGSSNANQKAIKSASSAAENVLREKTTAAVTSPLSAVEIDLAALHSCSRTGCETGRVVESSATELKISTLSS